MVRRRAAVVWCVCRQPSRRPVLPPRRPDHRCRPPPRQSAGASGPRRVGRVECARAAARVGSSGPSQPHAPIPAKRAGRPTSEKRGIWQALRSSEAPASGVRRAVALLSHRDKLRTAGAPREGPRPQTAGPRSCRNRINLSRKNGCGSTHPSIVGRLLLYDARIRTQRACLAQLASEPKSYFARVFTRRSRTRTRNPPLQTSSVFARSPCVVKMTQT